MLLPVVRSVHCDWESATGDWTIVEQIARIMPQAPRPHRAGGRMKGKTREQRNGPLLPVLGTTTPPVTAVPVRCR